MTALSNTINEHNFVVSLEETFLFFFTLWLWSGYSQDHTNHDIVHFQAKFTLKQSSGLNKCFYVFAATTPIKLKQR